MIKQIKFVSVPVADQDRALDFYTEKLRFTIITDQPFDEKQRWIELRVPKAETRLVLFTTRSLKTVKETVSCSAINPRARQQSDRPGWRDVPESNMPPVWQRALRCRRRNKPPRRRHSLRTRGAGEISTMRLR